MREGLPGVPQQVSQTSESLRISIRVNHEVPDLYVLHVTLPAMMSQGLATVSLDEGCMKTAGVDRGIRVVRSKGKRVCGVNRVTEPLAQMRAPSTSLYQETCGLQSLVTTIGYQAQGHPCAWRWRSPLCSVLDSHSGGSC